MNVVAQTASFSGNAFSVKKARGRFRSPRGQAASVQNVRRCADRKRDILLRERVTERRHVTIQSADGPAFVLRRPASPDRVQPVAKAQSVKSGRGASKPTIAFDDPRPSAP